MTHKPIRTKQPDVEPDTLITAGDWPWWALPMALGILAGGLLAAYIMTGPAS